MRISDWSSDVCSSDLALLRVKDTAEQAAERARQSLSRTIPEAADALGKASQQALEDAVTEKVSAQMEQIAPNAQSAMQAANTATVRPMRKMITMTATKARVGRRLEDG